VWRVVLQSPPADEDVVVTLSHPSGFERAWIPFDPREREREAAVRLEDGRVVVTQPAGAAMPRAVYALPSGSAREPRGLAARIETGGSALRGAYDGPARVAPSGAPPPLLRVGDARRGLLVLLAWTPLPGEDEHLELSDDDVSALRELGYVE